MRIKQLSAQSFRRHPHRRTASARSRESRPTRSAYRALRRHVLTSPPSRHPSRSNAVDIQSRAHKKMARFLAETGHFFSTTVRPHTCAAIVLRCFSVSLGCGVLQLLQRTCLDAHARRLRCEPTVFTRERILAEALLLSRHDLRRNLQEARQRELARALLVHGAEDGVLECRQNGLDRFQVDSRTVRQMRRRAMPS
jgi:hypothetical protein